MWLFKKVEQKTAHWFTKTIRYNGFDIFIYVPFPEMKTQDRSDTVIYNSFEPHVEVIGQKFGYYTTATDSSIKTTLDNMEAKAKQFIAELQDNPSKLYELKKSLL